MTNHTIQNTYSVSAQKEFSVDINGNNYLVICGTHINGGFCCIPNWNFGCELGDPDDVFYNAEQLEKHFPAPIAQALAMSIADAYRDDLRSKPLTSLGLSSRAKNCLLQAGGPNRTIKTIGDIANMDRMKIYMMRNAGPVTRGEIALALKNAGIQETEWEHYLPKPKAKKSDKLTQPTDYLEKYLGDPECKAIWTVWSEKLIGYIGIQLATLEQAGPISEDNIKRLREALLSGSYQKLDDCLNDMYRNTFKETESASTCKPATEPEGE